jgi:phosphoserine phosphatase
LIPAAAVDALAGHAGVADQAAEIGARAEAGELDAAAAVRERVALLAGLDEDRIDEVREALQLSPEARTFVRTLRRLGYYVGVVSSSFTVFTNRVVDELGLDFAAANELEIVDGALTGGVLDPIMDRAGRGDALRRFADKFGVPLSQTVAVGDGTDDIDMLETAGLGIAFTAKAAPPTDDSPRRPYLDTVLFVLGITREEIDEAAAE